MDWESLVYIKPIHGWGTWTKQVMISLAVFTRSVFTLNHLTLQRCKSL